MIKVGLVGCGGRGKGAAENVLDASTDVELVALGDLFEDRLDAAVQYFNRKKHPRIKLDKERCFTGFDAYKRVIECVDYVLLCTPPGFRPVHFAAAVEAGKHVFMEKPVAVDPVGVRKIIEFGRKAAEKGIGVLAGTQFRHAHPYVETVKRIHDGAIGQVRYATAYYNTGHLWVHKRREGESDMEYQIRNWYYFDWLSGDHIVEQHIHTIDVCNWALKGHPIRATGVGGRAQRTGEEYGNIYDHFTIDYEYPDGVHVMSMCRQWRNVQHYYVGAHFFGTRGRACPYYRAYAGEWKYSGKAPDMYVQEHKDMIESIQAGKPLNEAEQVAESTLTAIMGREAAYTGKVITWDEIYNSNLDLSPAKYEFGPNPVRPVPIPGKR